jgi:beta-galactosidase
MLADLPPGVRSAQPLCMEDVGQDHGFILYRTVLNGPRSGQLTVTDLHDYGLVFLDGKRVGTLDRRKKQNSLHLQASSAEPVLEILVEAMGRVNFGQRLLDRKGITERVTLRGVTLMDWTMTPLPMDPSGHDRRVWGAVDSTAGPKLFRASFRLAETGDSFLDMGAWSKGVVWVNGRNLGRFWDAGPQRSLYLPAPWLREGRNEIVVLDLHRSSPAPLRGHRNRQERP